MILPEYITPAEKKEMEWQGFLRGVRFFVAAVIAILVGFALIPFLVVLQ